MQMNKAVHFRCWLSSMKKIKGEYNKAAGRRGSLKRWHPVENERIRSMQRAQKNISSRGNKCKSPKQEMSWKV